MKDFLPLKRVMLIDDDSICKLLVARMLKKYHFADEILSYENGSDALHYLSEHQYLLPEIIFLDLNMPHMSGYEFLKEFGTLNKNIQEYCPIVMLSSSTDPEDIRRTMEYRFVRLFLIKPLTHLKLESIATAFSKLVHNN